MREIRVYDGDRQQIWRAALAPDEVAVFHVDAASGRHQTAHGTRLANHWERTCLVFPSLDDAVTYAHSLVEERLGVACQLFDADSDAPTAVVQAPDERRRADPARARRRLLWGLTLIALGVVGVLIDWHFEWYYLLGVLVGVKLLTVGFVRFGEGFVELRRASTDRRNPER